MRLGLEFCMFEEETTGAKAQYPSSGCRGFAWCQRDGGHSKAGHQGPGDTGRAAEGWEPCAVD